MKADKGGKGAVGAMEVAMKVAMKGSKEVKPYDGPRDKAGMLEWIKKNSTQDLAIDVEAMLEKEAEPTEEF